MPSPTTTGGVAEVIFGAGKTPAQIEAIASAMQSEGERCVLITRLSKEAAEALGGRLAGFTYHETARIGVVGAFPKPDAGGRIVIATGGTSDLPVAEEAALTAEALGNKVVRLYDVGVSGLHRLLAHLDDVSYSNGDARNTYEAEIRFLRALTYFHLVTEWGDVPLILTELKTKDEVQANNYRRPKSEVYKAVFADLDYVLGSPLADMQPASECGRASKAAAWTLYGKAKLQYACDEDFASEKSASLTSAIEKLTAAWNLRSFGELSDIPYNAIWDLSTQKSCAENIFQINYIQNNADLGSTWNYLFGPSKTGITSNKVGLMQNMTTKSVYDAFAKEDVRKNYLRETTVAGVTYYHTMKYADLECGANGYGGNNCYKIRAVCFQVRPFVIHPKQ